MHISFFFVASFVITSILALPTPSNNFPNWNLGGGSYAGSAPQRGPGSWATGQPGRPYPQGRVGMGRGTGGPQLGHASMTYQQQHTNPGGIPPGFNHGVPAGMYYPPNSASGPSSLPQGTQSFSGAGFGQGPKRQLLFVFTVIQNHPVGRPSGTSNRGRGLALSQRGGSSSRGRGGQMPQAPARPVLVNTKMQPLGAVEEESDSPMDQDPPMPGAPLTLTPLHEQVDRIWVEFDFFTKWDCKHEGLLAPFVHYEEGVDLKSCLPKARFLGWRLAKYSKKNPGMRLVEWSCFKRFTNRKGTARRLLPKQKNSNVRCWSLKDVDITTPEAQESLNQALIAVGK